MEDNQKPQNAKKSPIPASVALNFAVLFVLFTAILTLQHYGPNLSPSAQKADEPPIATAKETVPQIIQPAPVEPPPAVAVEEAVQQITQPAVIEVPAPSAPEPEPVVTAAETAAPETDISEIELPAQPKPKTLPRRAQISEPRPQANRRPETEREISVEMLDNEGSRQTYLAANRGLPVPKENSLPLDTSREFIPFEKK